MKRLLSTAFLTLLLPYTSLHAQLDHFEFDTIAGATAGDSISIKIYAKDSLGTTDTTFTGSCQLSDSTGTISPMVTGSFTDGVWSGKVIFTKVYQNDVIRATYLIVITGDSNPFNITAGPLDHFDFSSILSPQTAGIAFPVIITARDEFGNLMSDFNLQVNLQDVTTTLVPTLVTFSGGEWSDSLTISQAVGADSVIASYGGSSGSSNVFTVDSGPLDHFEFTTISSPQKAGTPFAVSIAARDQYGNLVDYFTGTVNLNDVTGHMTPTSANFSGGLWSDSLTITEAVTVDSVTASYTDKIGVSTTFTVDSGPLDHFEFTPVDSTQIAGVSFPVSIAAMDSYGNLVDDFGQIVTLNDETGSLYPTSADFNAGWWSGQLTVTQVVTVDSVTASYSGKDGSSDPFRVDNNELDHFVITPVGDTQIAGEPFTVTIGAADSYGNLVDEFNDTANLYDVTGTLDPQVAIFSGGMWSSSNVTITQSTVVDSIIAAYNLKYGSSNAFGVVSNSLDRFEFSYIGTQTAGQPFSITIFAKDVYGNTVESFTSNVQLDDLSNSITPTSTGNFTNGEWTGDVTISTVYLNDKITAIGSFRTGESNLFNVVAAQVDHFEFSQISGNKTAGQQFSITISAKDSLGNTVETYTDRAFLSDTTGTINPTQTDNFQSGVWTGNVSITKAALGDWITADDTVNDIQGTSNQFNIVAADLHHFLIDPVSDKTAGVSFIVHITAYDQYGNVKFGFLDAVSLTDSSGTIYPTMTGNFQNGEVSQSVYVTEAMDGEWIRASYDSITGISNPFNVSPGSLDHFVLDPVDDQTAGTPFTITVTAYDAWENLKTDHTNPVSLSDLTFTINPTTTGPFTNGSWQGDVTISTIRTGDQITASYSNKTGTSNLFDVYPGGLDHFEFSDISPQTAGVPFSIDIMALDSLNNIITTFNNDVEMYDLTGSLQDTVHLSGGTWDGQVIITVAMNNDRLVAEFSDVMSWSDTFNVSPGIPQFLTLDPPDPLSITVGTSQVFTANVTDTYLNPISGASVTFIIKDTPDGELNDNPDDPNNTTGNESIQTGLTDTNGVLTVLYTASEISGIIDTLDAYSSPYIDQESVDDVSITTVDSGATKLVIIPEDPQEIRNRSGEIFTIIVEARDGLGNLDIDDTTLVAVSSAGGNIEFSKDDFITPITEFKLSGGSDTVQVRSCVVADNDTIDVEDIDSVGVSLSPYHKSQVFIEPNVPHGTISFQASKDTLTANSVDSTAIQSEVLVDSCGNVVEQGNYVTVTAGLGTITTQDQDPGTPGKQIRTDQDGRIQLSLRAGSSDGTSTVTATSIEGDAAGTIDILFQSPPFLTYFSGSLVPNTVSPGDSVSFQLYVKNDGGAGVTLNSNTIFQFTDGTNVYASRLTMPVEMTGGSDWDTLIFESEKVPEGMAITSYTPVLGLSGTDFNGNSFSQVLALDPQSLQISTMSILMVQSPADTVTIEDSLEVTLAIENSGEQSINIEEYGLLFNPTGDFDQFTDVPVNLPAGVTSYLTIGVKVNSLTPTGKYYIDGFASGTAGGSEIGDNSADLIDSLVVISLATADYVDGSLEPVTVSPGGEYSFNLTVRNNGESSVNLNTQNTKITIHGEGSDHEASLENETTMTGGGASTKLTFEEIMLDTGLVSGQYPVSIFLSGQTLHGGDFNQNLEEVDTIQVQSGPIPLLIPGSLSNNRLSKGFRVTYSLRMSNSGEATLDLFPESTSFYLSDEDTTFEAFLDQGEVTTMEPGDTALVFEEAPLPFNFNSGEFTPLLILDGEYNQITYRDTIELDVVLIQEPATLSVNADRSDTVVTIGQSFIVESIVENLGEAGLMDEGSLLLDLSGTDFSVADPLKPFGPSLPDTVQWTVTVPDTSTTGLYDIEVRLEEYPHDENTNPPQYAQVTKSFDKISVSVVESNELMVNPVEINGFPPRNVYAGQNRVPMMALELNNRGNAKNEIKLDSVKVSLKERGGIPISPPTVSISNLFVSADQSGDSVLATASDLSGENIVVDVSSVEYRIGSAPDSLYFFIDLKPSPGTETILLHCGGNENIFATDLSNGRPVEVVDALGSSLSELMSDFIVLSADDFKTSFKNYPNPFRAGSENTTFSYFLPENARVDMSIYTLTGELVKNFRFQAGSSGGMGYTVNTFQWDGKNGNGRVIVNGVYLCLVTAKLETGRVLSVRHKCAVMK